MIIFHSIDMDGYFSGALVMLKTGDKELVGADYPVADKIKEKILDAIVNRDTKPKTVYIVDFSFKPEPFDEIIDAAKKHKVKIVWVDHHETAIDEASEKMNKLPGIRRRDNKNAACWLVAEHLNILEEYDNTLLQMVSDYDVFNFDNQDPMNALPALFNAGFMSNRKFADEMVYRAAGILADAKKDPESWLDILDTGRILMTEYLGIDKMVARQAIHGVRDGKKYALVNCTSNPNFLINQFPEDDFLVTWSMGADTKVKMNFRAHKSNDTNVGDMAKLLAGGGHAKAAGATIPFDDFLTWMKG